MPKLYTPLQKETRILQVQQWILEGHTYQALCTQCVQAGLSTSTRSAERLIKTARQRWVQELRHDIELLRAQKIQELEALRQTLQPQYHGTPAGLNAIARIQAQIITLMGIPPAPHPQLTSLRVDVGLHTTIDYTQLSDETLNQILAARATTTR